MVAVQKNFQVYHYVDDDGVNWNKRGEKEAVRQAVDGSAVLGAYPMWRDSRSPRGYRARHIIYSDPTTFRTKRVLFYTAAAYAAVAVGTDTMAFSVEGETVAVDYTAILKVPEHKPGPGAGRQLADHA